MMSDRDDNDDDNDDDDDDVMRGGEGVYFYPWNDIPVKWMTEEMR